MSRRVLQNVLSREQSEGVGARVRRSIGGSALRNFDPFLLLDEFRVKTPAGFPDHPHRGFETVTYMLSGSFLHEDFCGHKGVINPGDLQWMTAGKGIVHCEMPNGPEEGHGLQLWINLSKKDKMVQPAYQELLDKDIPKSTKDGVTVSVIAGESFGIKSPVYTRTPTMYLDFTMQPGSKMTQAIPTGWNAFTYILSGKAWFGPAGSQTEGVQYHTLTFTKEEGSLAVENKESEPCRFVLIGGKPLNEPIVQHVVKLPNRFLDLSHEEEEAFENEAQEYIPSPSQEHSLEEYWRVVSSLTKSAAGKLKLELLCRLNVVVLSLQHSNANTERTFSILRKIQSDSRGNLDQRTIESLLGPFVMNTNEEIHQAMMDYQSNKNGFENAGKWESQAVKNRGHSEH